MSDEAAKVRSYIFASAPGMAPGKYDALSQASVIAAGAQMACVMIVGDERGNGFSVSTTDLSLVKQVPKLLRLMADLIDKTEGNNQNIKWQ